MAVAYDTAGEIIADAALELGLGVITDPYGSADVNILQLCGLLKSGGRKLVFERDWTYLTQEYLFVTLPNWKPSTAYGTAAEFNSWAQGDSHNVGDLTPNAGNLYRCTRAGLTAASGVGPNAQTQNIVDGTCTWNFENAGTTSIVVHGLYQYTCANPVGTSGTLGPTGTVLGGTETDGTLTWENTGLASEYQMPPGFSNMLDQTGWNRTNRLPLGNPLSPQQWQYLKGRMQGVVFNVLFRPEEDTIRLYPDIDPPGLNTIAFEYTSRFWVSTVGSMETADADLPTKSSDVVFFDPLLMTRRLKLDWLSAKGFGTQAAQDDYETILERAKNADGAAPQINLRGNHGEPLLGLGNIPITGYGS